MVKYLALLILTVIALAQLSESKPAYQVLKTKEGYIPVFIRYGNQPLSEIDPLLAEAFGEHDIAPRNIKDKLKHSTIKKIIKRAAAPDYGVLPEIDTKLLEGIKRSIQTWKETNPKLLANSVQPFKGFDLPDLVRPPVKIDVQILDNPQINFNRRRRDFPSFETPTAVINDFKNAFNMTGISTRIASVLPDLSGFKFN